ncbi:MAG: methyltransferase domain-containing protein [Chloroflexi bacterium]|nr:methyltransferase domain-containing protein [Chloroflexota bacterium]
MASGGEMMNGCTASAQEAGVGLTGSDALVQPLAMSRKLNLGCGVRPILGAINIDQVGTVPADIHHDLNVTPWPLPDSHFDEVLWEYPVMNAVNETVIMERIGPDDMVLDIGGWARPFNRANYVIDQGPYETRGEWYRKQFGLGAQGGLREYFTKETWIVRDICDREPYPFADKSIDYVICSHTLEDVRDPIWVCSEMNRIAKRGYIEVPSRAAESIVSPFGTMVGGAHHRWLIDVDRERSVVVFSMKSHLIHTSWKYRLPRHYGQLLPTDGLVEAIFWEGSLCAVERRFIGEESIQRDLEAFIRSIGAYSALRYQLDARLCGLAERWAGLTGKPFPGRRVLARIRKTFRQVLWTRGARNYDRYRT